MCDKGAATTYASREALLADLRDESKVVAVKLTGRKHKGWARMRANSDNEATFAMLDDNFDEVGGFRQAKASLLRYLLDRHDKKRTFYVLGAEFRRRKFAGGEEPDREPTPEAYTTPTSREIVFTATRTFAPLNFQVIDEA